MEEESFPRGGIKRDPGAPSTKYKPKPEDLNLFQKPIEKGRDKKNKKKNKKDKLKKLKKIKSGNGSSDSEEEESTDQQTGGLGEENPVNAEMSTPRPLTKKTVYPGMLMLGSVQSIQMSKYQVVLSLPNGLSGVVPVTNISAAYTEALQRNMDDTVQDDQPVAALNQIFRVGQVLPCRLSEEAKADKQFSLSVDPRDVNSDLKVASITAGMFVHGNVASCEDHGYIIDIGVKGVHAFLKTDHATSYIQQHQNGTPLQVGQCLTCKVLKDKSAGKMAPGEQRVINVTINPNELAKPQGAESLQISSVVPGMKVTTTVEKVEKDSGLVVTIGKLKGVIHRSHLPGGPSKYKKDQELTAVVTYIHPLVKTIGLSLMQHLVTYTGGPHAAFTDVSLRSVLDSAIVTKVDGDRGVYLRWNEHYRLFAFSNQLSDKKEKKASKLFPLNSKQKCRVVGFFSLDGIVLVSLKKSVVDEKIQNANDVKPGELVECTLTKFEGRKLLVKLGNGVKGCVPPLHVADTTIQHPELKFSVGDKLKCRVLTVRKGQVELTNKKSLVTSKYPIVTHLDQLSSGMQLEGVITSVKSFGCHVTFFNNVQGLVPVSLLSEERIEYPEKVFYLGQIVTCKVVEVFPSNNKLKLSLILDNKKGFGKKEGKIPADYQVGKCVKCIVHKKTPEGIDVRIDGTEDLAYLPRMHLSDSVDMCNALWDKLQLGDMIEEAMFWNKKKTAFVTCKQCLIEGAKTGSFPATFEDVKLGMMLPGVVKNIQKYGLFVEFPNNLFALVPNQFTTDARVPDISTVYQPGHSILGKVLEIDEKKRRFMVSLRMKDCYLGDTDIGLNMTKTYLHERQKIVDLYGQKDNMKGRLSQVKVGSVHTATVTRTTDLGLMCTLEDGLSAVATMEHTQGMDLEEGSSAECVVLYTDINKKCLEVSFLSDLVRDITYRGEAKQKRTLNEGEKFNSNVLLIKEDFVLVRLKGEARGILAYMPAKRHWNDVLERFQYEVGQKNPVIVRHVEEGLVLVSLKVHEDKGQTNPEEVINQVVSHSLQLGEICDASVFKIYPDQLYIKIGNIHGRVHVTEMVDTVKQNGTSPISEYKIKDRIKVRVIGFREHQTLKYLPISSPKMNRAMPECSMKPSIMKLKPFPRNYDCRHSDLQSGEKVPFYLATHDGRYFYGMVKPTVHGRVWLPNMDDSISHLTDAESHFPTGKLYAATVLDVGADGKVELSLRGKMNPTVITEGDSVRGLVTGIKPEVGLVVHLTSGHYGTVWLTELSDRYTDIPTDRYKVGQVVDGHAVLVPEDSKERVTVSLRSDSLISKDSDRRISSREDVHEGDVVRGFITKFDDNRLLVRLGYAVSVSVDTDKIIDGQSLGIKTLKKMFNIANVVTVKIISVPEEESGAIMASMLQSDTGVAVETKQERRERTRTESQSSVLSDGEGKSPRKHRRKRTLSQSSIVSDDSVSDTLLRLVKKERKRSISQSSQQSDVQGNQSISKQSSKKDRKRTASQMSLDSEIEQKVGGITPKKIQKEKVKLKNEPQRIVEAMEEDSDSENSESEKENSNGETSTVVRKRKISQSEIEKEMSKLKTKLGKKSVKVEDGGSASSKKLKATKDKNVNIEKKATLEVGGGFSWDGDFKLPTRADAADSSSDEDDRPDKIERVKKTRAELRQEKLEEEKRLYKYEMSVLEGEREPQTADDYDRLVLQSPNSSLVWLRYMAFHLETSEIDKARAVAERALKTIAFREEQEKMNVWVAYLNLETLYGTPESVKSLLARALQHCDQTTVYLHMVNIYVNAGKPEEGEHVFHTLVKKQSENKDVWLKFGEFYFTQARPDSARKLMQRALKSLEPRHHVDVLSKFAQLEFKHGEPERGKTMFENVLNTYPKRTDLWSVFIDMVTKLGETDNARALYNRVVGMKMSAKKMKFFFKKYLQFEEKHGTETSIAEVKHLALKYVEGRA